MKKIMLASVFLFVLCAGSVRADIISPEEKARLEQLKKLPKEERLKRCQELGSFKIWNKYQWWALGCDELMMKKIDKKDAPESEAKNPAPAPQEDTDSQTNHFSTYGLAGLLVLLISGLAVGLLWRKKQSLPRAL